MRLDNTGQEIKIGSYVAYTTATTGLKFAKVERYTPKLIKLQERGPIPHTHMIVIHPSMPNYQTIQNDIEQALTDRARLMFEIERGDYG